MKKLWRIFYSVKSNERHTVKRILFFKFKKTRVTPLVCDFEPVQLQKIRLHAVIGGTSGRCSYAHHDLEIASKETRIGQFCSIGRRCVLGHGTHPVNYLSSSPYLYFDDLGYKIPEMVSHPEYLELAPITVGNDVWIGDGVFVKNGVTIGDGAIIGARSLVMQDVPPYGIVVGTPARLIRHRFTPEQVSDLLRLKWWDLPDDIIRQIPYDDIDKAITFLKGQA